MVHRRGNSPVRLLGSETSQNVGVLADVVCPRLGVEAMGNDVAELPVSLHAIKIFALRSSGDGHKSQFNLQSLLGTFRE